jgi:hypothetical protein
MFDSTWRVALIDSCGVAPSVAPADAAAFAARGGSIECLPPGADPTGHGTRISQLLQQSPRPTAGRSRPRARLLLAQVFTASGPTSGAVVAAAIDWAVARGAGLIHMSLGLGGDRAVLAAAVARAVATGCLLVAATPARGGPVFPAAYPGVIRATGDARCAPGEISHLGAGFFGGCPRFEPTAGDAASAVEPAARGGASIGAAWVTRAVLDEAPGTGRSAAVAALAARAAHVGPERRAPGV